MTLQSIPCGATRLAAILAIVSLISTACAPAAAPAAQPAKVAEPAKPAASAPAPAGQPSEKPAAPAPAAQPASAPAPAAAKLASVEKVKFGFVPVFDFMTLYAAKELGYFTQEGVDAEFIQFKSGGEVTTAMLGKSIDVAATATDRAVVLAEKGQQTKNLVATLNRVQQAVLVRGDVDVKYGDLKALKGKKLGVTAPGGGTDVYLRYFLKTAGLDPDKDVTVVAVGPPAAQIAALQAKQIDGLNTNEPVVAQAVHQMKIAKLVLDVAKDGPGLFQSMPFLSLGATAEWIDAHKDTAKKVIRAQTRANNELRTNPEKATAVARKYFENVDPALWDTVLKNQAPYYKSEITEAEMKAAVQLNKELGLVTKDIPYEAVTVAPELRDLWK